MAFAADSEIFLAKSYNPWAGAKSAEDRKRKLTDAVSHGVGAQAWAHPRSTVHAGDAAHAIHSTVSISMSQGVLLPQKDMFAAGTVRPASLTARFAYMHERSNLTNSPATSRSSAAWGAGWWRAP